MAEDAKSSAYMGSPYVKEAVEGWLAYLTIERQLAANTAEAYERDISQFLAFFAGKLNKLPDMNHLSGVASARRSRLSCRAARRRRRQPQPLA